MNEPTNDESPRATAATQDEQDAKIISKIFAIFATLLFAFSLLYWLPYLLLIPVLPMAFDGGFKLSIISTILSFIAYPIWGLFTLWLIWKHQKPQSEYFILSGLLFVGILVSVFF